jgi:threonyl-tRNA synthetase
MIIITLPDGKKIEFATPVTVEAIALAIGPKLARDAILGNVDDIPVDLSYLVDQNAKVKIITSQDPEALEILRHSTAHLLAHAVKELFPDVKLAIGPAIENGFYYDFSSPTHFTEEDLAKIEVKMHELVKRDIKIERKNLSHEKALELFSKRNEKYKVEMINELAEGEEISVYQQGDFIDFCRGPHVPSTGKLKVFKLTKIAGAYWRGNSMNEMLQRIYGTAWATEKELKNYLEFIEEAKKRDHRLLGKKMDLFHLQEEAPGLVFWHANGWTIYQVIRNFIAKKVREFGYQEVSTPIILDSSLWEKSGHWDKFGQQHMFITQSENRVYAIKPMNCPGHLQIFKQGIKSYRDLPLRYAEFNYSHRNEDSGALHGLLRVRGFVVDDGHILCTENQIDSESAQYIDQLISIYADFGFNEINVKLATRPEKRVGSDESWDKAEKALINVLDKKKIAWQLHPGEGAFYGPKLEFTLKDCLGRVWQCGTFQIDFSMAERLGATYVAEDGSKKYPVMLHRAMLGSIERFIGILLEDTAGNLPLWLAPIQAVVLNITDEQSTYAKKITSELTNLGWRINSDLRNEKISFKIREHTLQKVPFMIIVGDKEMHTDTISVRSRDGRDLGTMPLAKMINLLQNEACNLCRERQKIGEDK